MSRCQAQVMWELEDDIRPLVALRRVSLATCWTSSFVTSSRISVSRVLVMTIWGRGWWESLKRLASPRGEWACAQVGSSLTGVKHWPAGSLSPPPSSPAHCPPEEGMGFGWQTPSLWRTSPPLLPLVPRRCPHRRCPTVSTKTKQRNRHCCCVSRKMPSLQWRP